jgi:hypothetical protein
VNRSHVMNPVRTFGAALGGPNGSFAAFKLLEALAPALVQTNFAACPGGLRINDAEVDIILDANAAKLAAMSKPSVDYLAETGFSLLTFEDSNAGLSASLVTDSDSGLIYVPNLRPWFTLEQTNLILVQDTAQNEDNSIEAVCVSADRPVQRFTRLFITQEELQRGFDEANTLADLWREVIWLGGVL